jgi:diapolycopene oxygenase
MVQQAQSGRQSTTGTSTGTGAASDFDAIIIGGGLAGLAASVELAARGKRVAIVERNAHLGGKMNVLREETSRGTFTFDMGPTIITLPQVLLGILKRAGRDPSRDIRLVDLDPQWRCMYEDGTVIDLRKKVDVMSAALEKQFPGRRVGEGYRSFIEYSRRMYNLSEKVFFYKDVGSTTDLMRASPLGDPKLLGDVLAMRMHSTMAGTVHKHIEEPHVQQIVEHFLQYVGSSPFLAPAILSLIAAAQVDHGCWYPMGGTREVAGSLARAGESLGVTAFTSTQVLGIVHDGKRASGVEIDGPGGPRTLKAGVIVSNCDVQRTLRMLGPTGESRLRSIARTYTPACSGVVLYLGLSRQYEHLAHHDFLFSRSSRDEFADIYGAGDPARDPTLYLAVPSRSDPSQAPAGCESLYILVHTPYLRDRHQWLNADGTPGPLLKSYRRVILDKLKRFNMADVEEHIVAEKFLTPTQIDRTYNAEGGAIYGLASHGKLVGGFKPRNRSLVLKNLYLAGGSANPGPGVPMVLMSGVTAANAALEDMGIDPGAETMAARGVGGGGRVEVVNARKDGAWASPASAR